VFHKSHLSLLMTLAAAVLALSLESPIASASTPAANPVPSYVFVHDPSMIREGNTWYLFSTGDPNGGVNHGNIQIRVSTNLRTWRLEGTVFSQIPAWITKQIPLVQNLWAPDISYFNGLYHVYYAASSFGSNNSIIALATNRTLNIASPEYHWVDDGTVFSSTSADDYNAIDPALITQPGGKRWLLFGSFWSGIKILALNPATGKPSSANPHLYSLASAASPDPVEGSYMIDHDGYYYLFISNGACCRGIGSTYQILVGRSPSITGPFVDPNGTAMTSGGGMELLGSDEGMIGPGSLSVTEDGPSDLMVYHYYDAWAQGQPWVQIRQLYWTSDGWPVTGPAIVPVPGAPSGS
jgi:arabinan endo-1,5-alpha-L-arabinosidase